ncbi:MULTISPECIES: DUF6274 family protein [unclassified Streptomyces]|uniref:DUF6274 family protein n=1 Tax=unclassified Streptomyces TaxID=2593676 RepID=UPI00099E521C|nr:MULTISPECIES: DUF6274 family protein [unclassified Streptomyces]
MAAASAARHDTGALLRAHLAAASRYGHLTRHCAVCHRLLRLAMELPEPPRRAEAAGEPAEGHREPGEPGEPGAGAGEPEGRSPQEPPGTEDESPTDP